VAFAGPPPLILIAYGSAGLLPKLIGAYSLLLSAAVQGVPLMFMIISFASASSSSRGASAHQICGSHRLHNANITDVLELKIVIVYHIDFVFLTYPHTLVQIFSAMQLKL
jgi:hypothetical protein